MIKTARKIIVITVAVIVFVIVAGMLSIRVFGGRALKFGIESVASKTMGVDVTVEKVSFSVLGGRLKLTNLIVGNPAGYQHENLLELGTGEVKMDIGSLLSDEIVVETVALDKMNLVIEQKEIVHNNLQEILEALPSPEEEQTQAKEPGKKVHVDKLSITNTTVKAKLLPIPGRADTVGFNLADIEMTDLGKDSKMTPAILVAKILRAVAVGIAETGRDKLPADMLGAMGSVLEASGEILKETGKKVIEKGADVGKDLIEGGKDLQKNVTDGLKGLLGGKKE